MRALIYITLIRAVHRYSNRQNYALRLILCCQENFRMRKNPGIDLSKLLMHTILWSDLYKGMFNDREELPRYHKMTKLILTTVTPDAA